MPVWTNASNGSWSDSSRWTGGIPNGAGAVAEFTVSSAGSALFIVSFPQDSLFTVGTLNIVTDTDDGWVFRGAVGTTSSALRFLGANGAPAFINVDTNGSTRETSLAPDMGLRVQFSSDVILTTANSDTTFRITAPIIGDGDLYKYGDGTLILNGANASWGGDLFLLAGTTDATSAGLGNAKITLGNDAELVASGTLANRIMINDDVQASTIHAVDGSTLTLSGRLISESSNNVGARLGGSGDTGTILLTGTSLILGDAGITIGGGTVRIGNASVAANYFRGFTASGLTQVAGTLDTNGFATILDNLDMDGGSILSSTGVLNLTVNDIYFAANSQSGSIVGTAGADSIVINAAIDWSFQGTVFTNWTNGIDTITINGSAGVNNLFGSGFNEIINGGAGADSMSGGSGNDLYFVDNAGDVVIEGAGQGSDRVYASVSYTLGAGQSVELFTTENNTGTSAINLTGNELADMIYGNDGSNILDGKAGADVLVGRLGNDNYYVDSAGDIILEYAGEGYDRVYASVSYTLAAGLSVELFTTEWNTGTNAINLTGNELAQDIYGNDGNNILDGKGGADGMVGRLGNDNYFVDNGGDVVVEAAGQGSDRVYASVSYTLGAGQSVELFTTENNTGTSAINLTGNELFNEIYGNDGANTLDGKAGSDVLIGRAGADTFAFTTALGANNVDIILDFQTGVDKIALDDAIFTGLGLGALPASAFVIGTGAADASDRIIYNSTTGALLFDADGVGGTAAVQFATLSTGLGLAATDFTVI